MESFRKGDLKIWELIVDSYFLFTWVLGYKIGNFDFVRCTNRESLFFLSKEQKSL